MSTGAAPRGKLRKRGADTVEDGWVHRAEVLRDVSDIKLRELMAPVVLILFAGTVVATYVIIFLWGFRKIELPNSFVHWLGAATVGQTAGMLTVILKDLFPGHPGSRSPTRKNKRTAATKTSEFPESQEL